MDEDMRHGVVFLLNFSAFSCIGCVVFVELLCSVRRGFGAFYSVCIYGCMVAWLHGCILGLDRF